MNAKQIIDMRIDAVGEWADTCSMEELEALANELASSAKAIESDIMSGKVTDDTEYRKLKARASTLNMLANRKRYVN